jgi:hypothetical protein
MFTWTADKIDYFTINCFSYLMKTAEYRIQAVIFSIHAQLR